MLTGPQVIVLATPVFFLLIGIELFVGWRRGRNTYRLNDAINSIGLGIMSQLVGVLTTGDLTRLAERDPAFLACPVTAVMTLAPKTASPGELAAAAVGTMERFGVIALPVVEDDGTIVGSVHLHDLMRAGAV